VEEIFVRFAEAVSLLVGGAAVLIVAFGSLQAFVQIVRLVAARGGAHVARKAIWRQFGMWLLLGLEFELAADIIESVVAPTWEEIGKLGAIAVIRTFLNFFLERDIESAGTPE
jgi:uncharacterized membrane protein